MKRLLIFPLLLIVLTTAAQQLQSIPVVNHKAVKEDAVVKDSAGTVWPYHMWMQRVNSGNYTLKEVAEGADSTTYLLLPAMPNSRRRVAWYARPAESEFFTTGEVIKPFKITDIYGNSLSAKGWAGKTVVLNFWFINCPPCRQEIPELNKIAERYANNPNVIFLGIALDPEFEIKSFIKHTPFEYVLVGDGRSFANKFGIHLFPTNVVIDKAGKVQFHSSGYSKASIAWIDSTIAQSENSK